MRGGRREHIRAESPAGEREANNRCADDVGCPSPRVRSPATHTVHVGHVRRSRGPVLWLVRAGQGLASWFSTFRGGTRINAEMGSTMVARFQLARGATALRPAAERWPAEWVAAMPDGLGWSFDRGSFDDAEPATAWRLVGANNRELGRSAATYPDLASCREAIAFAREHIDESEGLLANASDTGLWIWRLNIGHRWIAAAGRSYLRRRECQYNLAQFIAEVPTAVLSADVRGRSDPRSARRAEWGWLSVDQPSPNQPTTT